MLDWAFYAVSVVALLAALWRVDRAAVALRLPRALTLGVAGGLIVYVGLALPAAVGCYTPPAVAGGVTFVSAVALAVARRFAEPLFGRLPVREPGAWAGPWTLATAAVAAAGVAGLRPLLDVLRGLPGSPAPQLAALPPNPGNPFELICAYTTGLGQARSAWAPAIVYAPVVLVAGMAAVGSAVVRGTNALLGGTNMPAARAGRPAGWLRRGLACDRVNSAAVGLAAVGLFGWAFLPRLAVAGGSADLFVAAALVAALGLLLEANRFDEADDDELAPAARAAGRMHRHDSARSGAGEDDLDEWEFRAFIVLNHLDDALAAVGRRRRVLLVLSAAALGLAVGTSPAALSFVPLFVCLAVVLSPGWAAAGGRAAALGRVAAVAAGAAVVGGFGYVRNFVLSGHPLGATGDRASAPSSMSDWPGLRPLLGALPSSVRDVLPSAAQPALFATAAVVFVLLVLVGYWHWQGRSRAAAGGRRSPAAAWALAAFLATAGACAITPAVTGRDWLQFLRPAGGLPLLAAGAVAVAVAAAQAAAWRGWRGRPGRWVVAGLAAVLLIGRPAQWQGWTWPSWAQSVVRSQEPPTRQPSRDVKPAPERVAGAPPALDRAGGTPATQPIARSD